MIVSDFYLTRAGCRAREIGDGDGNGNGDGGGGGHLESARSR